MLYNNYEDIICEADKGNPHAIFELSKLYRAGIIADDSGSEDIRQLERFFQTPKINALLMEMEQDDEDNPDDDLDAAGWSPDDLFLIEDINKAGIELGLYYRYSSQVDELLRAQDYLYSALMACKFDYYEINMGGRKADLISILNDIDIRLKDLGLLVCGETDE